MAGEAFNPKLAKLNTLAETEKQLYQQGVEDGKVMWHKEMLGYLEKKYMDPSISRDSDEARAILEVVKDLSRFMKLNVPA